MLALAIFYLALLSTDSMANPIRKGPKGGGKALKKLAKPFGRSIPPLLLSTAAYFGLEELFSWMADDPELSVFIIIIAVLLLLLTILTIIKLFISAWNRFKSPKPTNPSTNNQQNPPIEFPLAQLSSH
jgi:hypothetical protein